MVYVAWFKDLNKDSISVAGGKGANLGEMYNLGFPVPGGFSVTAQCYGDFIKKTGVKGLITLNTFDSISIDTPINEVHIDDLQAFSLNLLEPRGSTPLFDAIGLAIYSLQNIDTFSDDKKVLVIVTDGRENSSREYNYADISEMIKEKEESGWLIIYLGADHDVFKQARSLNFSQERIMKYSKKDSVDTFKAVSRTTRDYSRGTGNKSISFTEDERRKSDK